MAYHYCKKLLLPFEEVVRKVKMNLQEQGFTFNTSMDMRKILKEDLNLDFRNYILLNTCHPLLSYKAMSLDPNIGSMLASTIVIQEHENGMTEVTAVNPMENLDHNMITLALEDVGIELSNRLRTALDSIQKKKNTPSFSYT